MSAERRNRDVSDIEFAEGVKLPPPLTPAEARLAREARRRQHRPALAALDSPNVGAPWLSLASQAEQAALVRRLVDAWYRHAATGCDDAKRCPHLGLWVAWLVDWRERRSGEDIAVELRRLERVAT